MKVEQHKENSQKNFFIYNKDVCTRLKLHGEDIKKLFLKNNWNETKIESADIVFINTCSFLKWAEDRAVSNIKEIKGKIDDSQKIAIFGCLPSHNLPRLKELNPNLIFPQRELDDITEEFNLEEFETEISHNVVRKKNWWNLFNKYFNKLFLRDNYFTYLYEKERVYHLKISTGCLGNCTFCSERFSRGPLNSKKIEDIVREFECGLEKGYKIFSFNADDTGVFGWDNNENIAELLREILNHDKEFRLMITELNPFGLTEYSEDLIPLLSSKRVDFMTVPIQSGNQEILDRMNRKYNIEKVIDILKRIRENNPNIKINTHLIVGFPSENKKQFKYTCKLLDDFYFNKVKAFRYSERPGTPASKMDGKICKEERERRRRKIHRKTLLDSLKKLSLKDFLLNLKYFS